MAAEIPTDDAAPASKTAQTGVTTGDIQNPATHPIDHQQQPLSACIRDALLACNEKFRQAEMALYRAYDWVCCWILAMCLVQALRY
jgi:hypothetical protein